MSRSSWIALVLVMAVTLPGCDGEATYRDRPVSYWIDASRSANTQTRQQAIGALMTFADDVRAGARLAQIRSETLAQRGQMWDELCTWLQDASKTREHRATITTYIDNMPDSEDGIVQYTAMAFPGKWDQMRQILLSRVEQTEGKDQELYQSLLRLH